MSSPGDSPVEMTRPDNRGVLFMANDPYLEWVRPFLESFRAWNPSTPLTLIPFDHRVDVLTRLSDRYEFSVMVEPSLTELDEIGRLLLQENPRPHLPPAVFRKLACFWADYDPFVFLDADIVVTSSVFPFFDTVAAGRAPFAYALPIGLDMIFRRESILYRRALDMGFEGISTGVFSSRVGLFALADIRRHAAAAADLSDQIRLEDEQAFLNWCLFSDEIATDTYATTMGPTGFLWPGDEFDLRVVEREQGAVLSGQGGDTRLVHWAGMEPGQRMPYRELWRRYRWPGASPLQRARRSVDRLHPYSIARRGKKLIARR